MAGNANSASSGSSSEKQPEPQNGNGGNGNGNGNGNDNDNDNDNENENLRLRNSNEDEHKNKNKTNLMQALAMISNFSTSYNVVNISLVLPILKHMLQSSADAGERDAYNSSHNEGEAAIVASSLLAGMMIGQLLGGALGDSWGHYNALRMVLFLQILGSLGSAILVQINPSHSPPPPPPPFTINTAVTRTPNISSSSLSGLYFQLALWRLLLGIGAGGVYPLAAVLSSSNSRSSPVASTVSIHPELNNHPTTSTSTTLENTVDYARGYRVDAEPTEDYPFTFDDRNSHLPTSNNYDRNMNTKDSEDADDAIHRVVLTFSMQGLGFVTVPILAVILLFIFPNQLNFVWRFLLAFGSVPGILVFVLYRRYHGNNKNNNSNNNYNIFRSTSGDIADSVDDDVVHNSQQTSNHIHRRHRYSHCHHHQSVPTMEECNDVADTIDNTSKDDDSDSNNLIGFETSECRINQVKESNSNNMGNNIIITDQQEEQNNAHHDDDNRNEIPFTEGKSWWATIQQEPNLCQKLLGTAFTWFLFDVLFYGNTLFQPIVVEAAFGNRASTSEMQLLQRTALDSLILTSIALPGYAVAGFVMRQPQKSYKPVASTVVAADLVAERASLDGIGSIPIPIATSSKYHGWRCRQMCCLGYWDRWTITGQSPRYVMLQGFGIMSVLYLIIGVYWEMLRTSHSGLLLLLYGLTFFFANYGPNTGTFVLPSTCVFVSNKSTWNGICAACGKFGALIGALVFEPAASALGNRAVMIICSGIAVVAYIVTWLFVPKQKQ